jgi:Fe-S cluster biosynthesis and repair protein YggX
MARMVKCSKFGEEMEGLEKPPFRGKMGQRIFDNASQKAWDEWTLSEVMVINEYQLQLGNPEHRQVLYGHMEQFLMLPPDSE